MKKKLLFLLFVFSMTCASTVLAQSNRAARVQYVLTNLGVDAAQQKKLKPLLEKYLAQKKVVEAPYDDMKDDLRKQIDTDKLSERQANALMKAKWESEQQELNLKKSFEPKFKTVISAAQTYKCFDLLNDKKSKVRGESN